MQVSRRSLATLALLLLGVWGTTQGLQRWSRDRLGTEVAALTSAGDIRMLSSITCVYCAQARAWFTEYSVPFSECFIERDAACAARYSAQLAPGTPLLLVRGQRLVGFSPERIALALRRPKG